MANNAHGDGNWSPITETTTGTAPAAPAAPTFSDITARGFTVQWTAPAANGPAIDNYEYEWRAGAGAQSVVLGTSQTTQTSVAIAADNLSTTVSNHYSFRVRAHNPAGWSACPRDRPERRRLRL